MSGNNNRCKGIPHIRGLFLLFLLLGPLLLKSQETSSPITISGANTTFGQYSNIQGYHSPFPASYARENLSLQIGFFEIPLEARLFLTSEQGKTRQSIDVFRLSLSHRQAYSAFKGKVPEGVKKVLKTFPTFEIGNCYPHYSRLTTHGIALSGINLEVNPGIFYSAFAAGRTRKAIHPASGVVPVFDQKMIMGRLGIGRKHNTHFYLSLLHFKDRPSSLESDTLQINPKENYIAGAEFQLLLFKNRFKLQSELNASLFSRDLNSPSFADLDQKLPLSMEKLVDVKLSTSVDYAYSIRTSLDLKNTRLSGSIRRIGPGYKSLGSPYLQSDVFLYEAKVAQYFLKKQLSLSAYFRKSDDNLINWKRSTRLVTAYGIRANIHFKKAPYFMVNYAPFYQLTDDELDDMETKAYLLTLTTGYHYKLAGKRASTNLFYAKNHHQNILDTFDNQLFNNTLLLSQSLRFDSPLVLSASLGYNTTDYSKGQRDIFSYSIRGSYGRSKKWKNTLGFTFLNQKQEKNKFHFYYRTGIKLWTFGHLNFETRQNLIKYKEASGNDFDEIIMRIRFTSQF